MSLGDASSRGKKCNFVAVWLLCFSKLYIYIRKKEEKGNKRGWAKYV